MSFLLLLVLVLPGLLSQLKCKDGIDNSKRERLEFLAVHEG
jgi:hypothetical protein